MYIVPRTPISPRRLPPIMTSSSATALSYASSQPSSPVGDVYDKFIHIYFSSDIKVQVKMLKQVINYMRHPVYTHLLKTMDRENAHHVMGYLKSQRSVELYFILGQVIREPILTPTEFFQSR